LHEVIESPHVRVSVGSGDGQAVPPLADACTTVATRVCVPLHCAEHVDQASSFHASTHDTGHGGAPPHVRDSVS
jgi:hypothetical protein